MSVAENLEFVLGKRTGEKKIDILKGCNKEAGIRVLYRDLLIQDGFETGYLPYKRNAEGVYEPLVDLTNEVEEKLLDDKHKRGGLILSADAEIPYGHIM